MYFLYAFPIYISLLCIIICTSNCRLECHFTSSSAWVRALLWSHSFHSVRPGPEIRSCTSTDNIDYRDSEAAGFNAFGVQSISVRKMCITIHCQWYLLQRLNRETAINFMEILGARFLSQTFLFTLRCSKHTTENISMFCMWLFVFVFSVVLYFFLSKKKYLRSDIYVDIYRAVFF